MGELKLYSFKNKHGSMSSNYVYQVRFPEQKEFWCEYIMVITLDSAAKLRLRDFRGKWLINVLGYLPVSLFGDCYQDRFQFSIPIVMKVQVDVETIADSPVEVFLGGRLVDEEIESGTRQIIDYADATKLALDISEPAIKATRTKVPAFNCIRRFNFDE